MLKRHEKTYIKFLGGFEISPKKAFKNENLFFQKRKGLLLKTWCVSWLCVWVDWIGLYDLAE